MRKLSWKRIGKKLLSSILVVTVMLQTVDLSAVVQAVEPIMILEPGSEVIPVEETKDLKVTDSSATAIDLEWIEHVGIKEYRVYRDNVMIDTTGLCSYSDVGISDLDEEEFTHEYKVEAVDENDQVTWTSDTVEAVALDNYDTYSSNTLSNKKMVVNHFNVSSYTTAINSEIEVYGDLVVRGNFNLIDSKMIVHGNVYVTNQFVMASSSNESDDFPYLLVEGDFHWDNHYSNTLSLGTVEVKGNFYDCTTYMAESCNYLTFMPGEQQKFIFSGDKKQVINLNSNSRFAILELKNDSEEGIVAENDLRASEIIYHNTNVSGMDDEGYQEGWKLEKDEEVEGGLNLSKGTLDLNGHKLTVKGDLNQIGGTIQLNGGELDVQGDYNARKYVVEEGDIIYKSSTGRIIMKNEADVLRIQGNINWYSNHSTENDLTNGKIYVDGNIENHAGDTVFQMGNFKVCDQAELFLTAGKEHQFSSSDTYWMEIASLNLEKNAVLKSDGNIVVSKYLDASQGTVEGILKIGNAIDIADKYYKGDVELTCVSGWEVSGDYEIDGTMYVGDCPDWSTNNIIVKDLVVNSDIYLETSTLTVKNDVTVKNGCLNIETGTLVIGGDLNVIESGEIEMEEPEAKITVEGNINWSSNWGSVLKDGQIVLKGNFNQTNGEFSNISCTGNHTLIMAGTKKQEIHFDNTDACLNIVNVENQVGVQCNDKTSINQVVGHIDGYEFDGEGVSGWTLTENEVIDGDFVLKEGTLNLNGKELHVKGNFIQPAGKVNFAGGKLVVDGDYILSKISKADGNVSYGKSSGTMIMNNNQDELIVQGSMVVASGKMMESDLSSGAIYLKKDLKQIYCGRNSHFVTSDDHKIVFNGSEKQNVEVETSGISGTNFANIEISNAKGIVLKQNLTVTGEISTNGNPVDGFISLTLNTFIKDDIFKGNLLITDQYNFAKGLTVEGTLKVYGGQVYINEDITVDDLECENGNLSINYSALTVNNDTVLTATDFDLNNGVFSIDGKFTMKEGRVSYYDPDWGKIEQLKQSFGSGSGYLIIGGDAEMQGSFSGDFSTEVEGNVSLENFQTEIDQVFSFCGEQKQRVQLDKESCYIGVIALNNISTEGVYFEQSIPCQTIFENTCHYVCGEENTVGWTVKADQVIDGDLNLCQGTLDLNGHNLVVKGNLEQFGGTIDINGGCLTIEGDAFLRSNAICQMDDENDKMVVLGSIRANELSFDKGELSVGGSLDLIGFDGGDDFTLRLTGDGYLTLYDVTVGTLDITGNSTISPHYVNVTKMVKGKTNKINGTINIGENTRFENDTYNGKGLSLYNLNYSHPLKTTGNLSINNCTITEDIECKNLDIYATKINNCMVKVNGKLIKDYEFGEKTFLTNSTLYVHGNYGIEGSDDYILCDEKSRLIFGNNLTISDNSFECPGIIEVKKHLTITPANGLVSTRETAFELEEMPDNLPDSYYETGIYNIVLSGTKLQKVQISSKCLCYGIDIQNESTEGVVFENGYIPARHIKTNGNKVITSGEGVDGWKLTEDTVIEDDLYLIAGTLDLNGHQLTVNGDFNIGSGVLFFNKGSVVVNGNFGLQSKTVKDGKVSYGYGVGSIQMLYPEDSLLVKGDFVANSSINNSYHCFDGTIDVKGNVKSVQNFVNYWFRPVNKNTFILSGESEQVISCQGTSNNGETETREFEFANLKILNTSEEGIRLDAPIRATLISDPNQKLQETNYVSGKFDGVYTGKIKLDESTLDRDIEGTGTIEISSRLNLSGHTIKANNIIVKKGVDVNKGALIATNLLSVEGGQMNMKYAQDYVFAGKKFVTSSTGASLQVLSDGVLEIRGDFEQVGSGKNFYASGNHTTIFSGKEYVDGKQNIQKITFENASSNHFAKVIFYRPIEEGFVLSHPIQNISTSYEVREDELEVIDPASNLEASDITTTSVSLNWTASPNESVVGYEVYRNGQKIQTVASCNYTDNGVNPDTEYTYYVCAINQVKDSSEPTDSVTVRTQKDTEAPRKITYAYISEVGGKHVLLRWNASSDNVGVDHYDIYRDGSYLNHVGSSELAYRDETVELDENYEYEVVAVDAAGNQSKKSDGVVIKVELPQITRVEPANNGRISGTASTLTCYFKPVIYSNVYKGDIEYWNGNDWVKVSRFTIPTRQYSSTEKYMTSGMILPDNIESPVKVRYTIYDTDNCVTQKEVSYEIDREPPKAVTNLKVSSDNGMVFLSWDASVSYDCKGYRIYRRSENGSYTSVGYVDGKDDVQFTDYKAEIGKVYYYTVTAVDEFYLESITNPETYVLVKEDKQKPEIVSITGDKKFSNQGTFVVEATDNFKVDNVDLYCRPENGSWAKCGTLDSHKDDEFTFEVDFSEFTEGCYEISAIAEDANQNRTDLSDSSKRVKIQVDHTGIDKIEGLSGTGFENYAILKWQKPANKDIAYYIVEQKINGQYKEILKVKNTEQVQVKKLETNREYQFRVVGYDDVENKGEYSEEITIQTTEDEQAPVIRTNSEKELYANERVTLPLIVEDNGNLKQITLQYTYDNETINTITSFEYEEGEKLVSLDCPFSVRNLAEGTVHVICTAKDYAGNVAEVNVMDVVIDHTAPKAVSALTGHGEAGSNFLRWDYGDSDVTFYIYRKLSTETNYTKIAEATSNTYVDVTAAYGKQYQYKIAVVDRAANRSDYSEVITLQRLIDSECPVISAMTPKDGTKVARQVVLSTLVTDNTGIDKVVFEYRERFDVNGSWTLIGEASGANDGKYPEKEWDVESLESKDYSVRAIAYDYEGNASEPCYKVYTVDNDAPKAVTVTAKGIGYGAKLEWTKADEQDFDHYEVFRKEHSKKKYEYVNSTKEISYVDEDLKPLEAYDYIVYAVDDVDNKSASQVITVSTTDEDIKAPVINIGLGYSVREGEEWNAQDLITTDNSGDDIAIDYIVGDDIYHGKDTPITFDEQGNQEVTVRATDPSGNTSEKKVDVEVRSRQAAKLEVTVMTDSPSNPALIANAYINIATSDADSGTNYNADGMGKAQIALEPGTYIVSAFAQGYKVSRKTVRIAKGADKKLTISLKEGKVVDASLTTTALSPAEIIELGVDLENPANWYQYTWITIDSDGNNLPPLLIGEKGIVVKGKELKIHIYTTEVLKDMFSVDMVIYNLAESNAEFDLVNGVATLNLPYGLSMLDTNTENSVVRGVEDIPGGQKAQLSWYIKADEPGKYDNITATYNGTFEPFHAPVSVTATSNPITADYSDSTSRPDYDDGFLEDPENAESLDINVVGEDKDGLHAVQGAVVSIEERSGLGCSSFTNSKGVAELLIDKDEDRTFTLTVTAKGYQEYIDTNFTDYESGYCEIRIYKEGYIPGDEDSPFDEDEYQLKMVSAMMNGSINILDQSHHDINTALDTELNFIFSFDNEVESVELISGGVTLGRVNKVGSKTARITAKSKDFVKDGKIQVKAETHIDGKEVSETYNFSWLSARDVVITGVKMTGYSNDADLLAEQKVICTYFAAKTLTFTISYDNSVNVEEFEIVQDGKVVGKSKNNTVKFTLGKLEADKDVYAKTIVDGKSSDTVPLTLVVVDEPDGEHGFSFEGDGISFKFPSNVPLLGGHEVKLNDLPEIPITCEFKEDYMEFGFTYSPEKIELEDELEVSMGLSLKVRKGYLEKKASGTLTFEAKCSCETESQVYWGVIPCTLGFEVGIGGSVDAKIEVDNKFNFAASGRLELKGTLGFTAGIGFTDFELGGYGELETSLDFLFELMKYFRPHELSLSGAAGLRAEAAKFEWKLELIRGKIAYDFEKDEITTEGSIGIESKSSKMGNRQLKYSLTSGNSVKVANRDYLNYDRPWNTSAADGDFHVLQQHAYTSAKPKLVSCGNTLMMFFIDDEPSREAEDRGKLVYSIYNKQNKTWSVPIAVNDDGTDDNQFEVYENGEDVYIIWQDAEKSRVGVKDLISGTEMYRLSMAKYSTSTGRVEQLGTIAETEGNNKFEMLPNILEKQGTVYAVWKENSENDIFGVDGKDTIFCYTKSENKETVRTLSKDEGFIAEMKMGILDGKVQVGYVNDEDHDTSTEEDEKCKLLDVSTASAKTVDAAARSVQFVKYDGKDSFVWNAKHNLYRLVSENGTPEKLLSKDNLPYSDLQFISDGENSHIVYRRQSDNKSEICFVSYDPIAKQWGEEVTYTNQNDYLENASGAYLDGQLYLALSDKKVEFFESDNGIADMRVENSICFMQPAVSAKAKVTGVTVDEHQVIPGGKVTAKIAVRNQGISSTKDIQVKVLDPNGKVVCSEQIAENVLPGQTVEVEQVIKLPYAFEKQNYTIKIYTDGKLTDEFTKAIGTADLEVSTRVFLKNGTTVRATVANKGLVPANGKIIFYNADDPDEIYQTKDFDEMAYGDTAVFEYCVPQAKLKDVGLRQIGVRVETEVEQEFTDNDETVATILLRENKTCSDITFVNGEEKFLRYTSDAETLNDIPVPAAKEGYHFDGWFYNGAVVTTKTVFKENATVTAKWTKNGSSEKEPQKPDPKPIKKPVVNNGIKIGTKVTVGGVIYQVKSNDQVAVVGVANKKSKKLTIADVVKVQNKVFKVTEIKKNAVKRCKKLKSLVIGKNVTTIAAKAISGCKALKKITVKSMILTKVGKKAIAKIHKKAVIKVPKKNKKLYKKFFKGLKVK
ncbi:MAG: fibronectin type III domain-containing protein [Eubacterium sp.]|nr:fibronectin type III domain-containing protein [Eubacterium sp.]